MKLTITEDKLISDIQAAFNHFFPYLKLEFYRSHTNPSVPVRVPDPAATIGDVTFGLQEGSIYLTENITVRELENIFDDRFGLHVQVLRKAGGAWVETSLTDKWSLKRQNDRGEEVSGAVIQKETLVTD